MDIQILIGLPPNETASFPDRLRLPDRFAPRPLCSQTDFFTGVTFGLKEGLE